VQRRKLVVYDVTQGPPVLNIEIRDINKHWREVLTLLGSKASWPDGIRPDFLPDLGLAFWKSGLAFHQEGKKTYTMFMDLTISYIGRVSDDLYTIAAVQMNSGFVVSLDVAARLYPKLLEKLETPYKEQVETGLKQQPYHVNFSPIASPYLVIAGEIGDHVHTNDNESYLPFKAEHFI